MNLLLYIYSSIWKAYNEINTFLATHSKEVHVLLIPIGFLMTFVGSSILHTILFTLTITFFSISVYFTLLLFLPSSVFIVALSLLLGFLISRLLFQSLPLGLFLLGASFGLLVSSFIPFSILGDQEAIAVICTLIISTVFGIIAVDNKHNIVFYLTSYLGAYLCVAGIGYFIGHFSLVGIQGSPQHKIVWDWWTLGYITAFIILGTLGVNIQRGRLHHPGNRDDYTPLHP